jgi:hypothetical protein
MSVSSELLCSFELLKPLDSNALKNHIKKGRNKRNHMLNSPVSCLMIFVLNHTRLTIYASLRMSILRASRNSSMGNRRAGCDLAMFTPGKRMSATKLRRLKLESRRILQG